jgi:hypothetical protein
VHQLPVRQSLRRQELSRKHSLHCRRSHSCLQVLSARIHCWQELRLHQRLEKKQTWNKE